MLNTARVALEKEPTMFAMAGKYIVCVERSKLILTHPTGISFDLTREDAKELAVLIRNWQLAIAMGSYKGESDAEEMGED